MARNGINSPNLKSAGPYSHAVATKTGLVYLSGQVGLDQSTGKRAPGGIEAETRAVFANLAEALKAAGCTFDHVVKCNVYLADMGDFATMNGIYAGYFAEPFPARTTVQAVLPIGARIEIEVVAERT